MDPTTTLVMWCGACVSAGHTANLTAKLVLCCSLLFLNAFVFHMRWNLIKIFCKSHFFSLRQSPLLCLFDRLKIQTTPTMAVENAFRFTKS